MEISAFGFSKATDSHPQNEDCFVLSQSDAVSIISDGSNGDRRASLIGAEGGLFVVCDGMGGHKAGNVASSIACASVTKFFQVHQADFEANTKTRLLVEQAVLCACQDVYKHAVAHPECRGMGSTLTLLYVNGQRAFVAHVGDSRLYLLRRGNLNQLSRDHTVVQEMIDQGLLPASATRSSPYSHVLSRAVGVQESVRVDVLLVDLVPGDKLMLCSDGVMDVLDDRDTLLRLLSLPIDKAPQQIVSKAVEAGGNDDKTVIVVNIQSSPAETPLEREQAERITLTMEVLSKVYLFENLATDELMRIVERCTVKSCKPGEFLIREGEIGDNFYIILKGFFDVSRGGKNIAGLGEGNHVGEMALLSGAKRTADVIALSEGMLLELNNEDFLALVNQEPNTGVKLLSALAKELSARLKAMNQGLDDW